MKQENEKILIETARLASDSLQNAEQLYTKIKQLKVVKMADMLGVKDYSQETRSIHSVFTGSTYPLKTLSSVIDDGTCIVPPGKITETGADDGVEMPVISPRQVETLRFSEDKATGVTVSSHISQKHGVKGGDILLAVSGTYAGASAIVPLFHGGALPGTGCVGLRAKSETCESFYLLNVLHFLYNTGLIQKEKKNDSLDMGTLSDIQLPVPPREIQEGIVSLMLTLSGVMVAQEACIAEAARLQLIIEGE